MDSVSAQSTPIPQTRSYVPDEGRQASGYGPGYAPNYHPNPTAENTIATSYDSYVNLPPERPFAAATPSPEDTANPVIPDFSEPAGASSDAEPAGKKPWLTREQFVNSIARALPLPLKVAAYLAPEALKFAHGPIEKGSAYLLNDFADFGDLAEETGFCSRPSTPSSLNPVAEVLSEVDTRTNVASELVNQAKKAKKLDQIGFTEISKNVNGVIGDKASKAVAQIGSAAGNAAQALGAANYVCNFAVEAAHARREGNIASGRVLTEASITAAQIGASAGAAYLVVKGAVAVGVAVGATAGAPVIALGACAVGVGIGAGYLINKGFNWIRDKVY